MLNSLNWCETATIKNVKTEEITEDMKLDKGNFFKKIIIPWYDSYPACWVLILLSTLVLIFALTGIEVTITNEPFRDYLWFPTLLASLAFMFIISVIFRIIYRNINR